MSDPAAPSVVVAGDVCLDVLGLPIPPRPRGTGGDVESWRQAGETRTFYRRGGAWQLADLIEGAVHRAGVRSAIIKPTAPSKSEEDLERLTRHEVVHALLVLKTVTEVDENKDEKSKTEVTRVRVAEDHGFSGPDDDRQDKLLQATLDRDVANPDLVVLDDTGNRFRRDKSLWPMAVVDPGPKPPLVVYKLHCPLPAPPVQNELWTTVRKAPRLVVVSVDHLREFGGVISRRLSWERTALDLVRQVNESDRLAELRQCPHLVVRLGLEGAVYWCNPGPGMTPRAWLVYDPTAIEGDWAARHAGHMLGYGSAFAAALVSVLLSPEDARPLRDGSALARVKELPIGADLKEHLPQLERGLKRGLIACRRWLEHGYVNVSSLGPDVPIDVAFAGPWDKEEKAFASIAIPLDGDPGPDGWTILHKRLETGAKGDQAVAALARRKKPTADPDVGRVLADLPRGVFGHLVTYDRAEIEAYRAVSNVLREYLGQAAPKRPLSLAVFGPPGSGKSFGVEQVAGGIAGQTGTKLTKLTFNLSQFTAPEQLARALHQVRDVVLKGGTPLVFFDEFDSTLEGNHLYWLKMLLAPMQDGEFLDQGSTHPLGRAVFAFAGGTAHTYAQFIPPRFKDGKETTEWTKFREAKGPDFVSRLRGVLDIPGIDLDPARHPASVRLRRASILRFQLWEKARHLFDSAGNLQIDDGVLRAFLTVRRFQHGVRSLEAVMDMSQLGGRTRFDPGSLPHPEQLVLHVEAVAGPAACADIGFIDLVHREPPFSPDRRELIAQAIHAHYLEERDKSAQRDFKKLSHQVWAQLGEFFRDSNRAQADDIPRKLKLVGLRVTDDPSAAGTDIPADKVEFLAEREHERWMADMKAKGYRDGEKNDPEARTNPAMKAWKDLPDAEKEKDRASVRAIPRYLAVAGYRVAANPSSPAPVGGR